MNRIEKYNAIKNVIDDWDPIDLYEIGASKGEYDFEITKISSEIENLKTKEEMGKHIQKVFIYMFGADTFKQSLAKCEEIAADILTKINEK